MNARHRRFLPSRSGRGRQPPAPPARRSSPDWLTSLDEPPEAAVAVLREAFEDESELVREHAAWALAQNVGR